MLIERQEAPSFMLNHFLQTFPVEFYAAVIPKRYNPGLAPGTLVLLFGQYVPMPAGKNSSSSSPGTNPACSRPEMMAS
ncbi:MAG: hypothetical protein WD672_09845 [Woeseia sp.]